MIKHLQQTWKIQNKVTYSSTIYYNYHLCHILDSTYKWYHIYMPCCSLSLIMSRSISHRKLTNLITWTTALSNSMNLWAMPCRATQDRRVIVERSDKTWSTGGGNGKPPQFTWNENLMNCIKGQTDMTPQDESPRSEDVQYATRKDQRRITNSPWKNEAMDQSGHDA